MGTQPRLRFPEGQKIDPNELAAKRYGTLEMCQIWGAEKTFSYSLRVQGQSALTLSRLHPDVVPPHLAEEIVAHANLGPVRADRIREIEEKTGHDVIGINTALEEQVSEEAGRHINKAKTSADTTQPARALQLQESLEVIANTIENLRDILIEKSLEWQSKHFMDTTHWYDALPTLAGRPFSHYIEMLQSGLNLLRFVYDNSIIGKWADATGNHHSATALGIDGMKLQEEFCESLGIGFMDAPAQIPGLEFEADVAYVMSRLSETVNNLSRYIAWGRSSDVGVFRYTGSKKKGSSAMPHKDEAGGNPTGEEQFMSERNQMMGNLVTAVANCEMPYARNLAASSNARINLEDGFKFMDHCLRRIAYVVYHLELKEERSLERIKRTFGVTTSQQVMTYLTDHRRTSQPMTRSEAHNLTSELAIKAYEGKIPFIDVLLGDERVTSKLSEETLREITNPLQYVGQSREIIQKVADKCYQRKTLD